MEEMNALNAEKKDTFQKIATKTMDPMKMEDGLIINVEDEIIEEEDVTIVVEDVVVEETNALNAEKKDTLQKIVTKTMDLMKMEDGLIISVVDEIIEEEDVTIVEEDVIIEEAEEIGIIEDRGRMIMIIMIVISINKRKEYFCFIYYIIEKVKEKEQEKIRKSPLTRKIL